MSMEAAVVELLLADAGTTALVGTRIYPVNRPQGSALPVIVFHRLDGGPEYADDGEVGLENGRIQIDAYAESYSGAHDVAEAVKAALSAIADVVAGGVTIRSSHVIFERDAREPGSNQDEYLYRRQTDMDIWIEV